MKKLRTLICSLLLNFCIVFALVAQTYNVSGVVRDAKTGDGLAGVNVVVKGTSTGTITDANGNFTLSVSGSPVTLIVSFIGYKNAEVTVTSVQTNVSVALEESITNLDEVVISGLATTIKRSNLANAVGSVDSKELMGITNPQTLDYALYGKLTGVNMNANGGAPGGGVNVNFRGITTLGSGASQPLYIIDGVYMNNTAIRNGRSEANQAGAGSSTVNQDDAANRLADLNPDDIERVEVLKGPSAAAIYGTRANAGVVIITTKRGKEGKTQISLIQDVGFARAQNLNYYEPWTEEKIDYYHRNYLGSPSAIAAIPGEISALNQAIAEGRNLDLEKEMYGETAFLTNTQINLSGGSQKTSFFISGGLQDEDGIIKNTGFKRYSIRANVDHRVSDRIKLGVSSNYIKSENQRGFTGNQNNTGGSLGYAIAYTRSYRNLKPDANGNYPDNPDFNDNPFAIRDLAENNQTVNRFITSGNLEATFIQKPNFDLKAIVNGGVDFMAANTMVYMPEILQHQRALPNPGDVIYGNQNDLNSNIQGFLVLSATQGAFNFTTQAGAVRLDQNSKYQLIRGQGLNGGQKNLAYAQVVSNMSQINQRTSDVGIYAQQEVNWQDRLIGTVGVRFDKSTLNLDQRKFYPFYKASLAANITNFGFWNISQISQLKLRTAFGQSGGLPLYNRTFVVFNSQLIGGEIGFQVGTRDVDPNLRPEVANELEFGMDAGFLNNRLNLEATYYIKNVQDLIIDLRPAESTGITAIATNGADLRNNGIELALSGTPISTPGINWFSRLAWWRNRAKITRLDIPPYTTGGFGTALGTYMIAQGYSPTTIVGTPVDPDNPAPVAGVRVIGDRQADFDMSWYNSLSYKNFELSFLVHYKKGGDNINLSALLWDDGGSTPGYMNDPDGNGIAFGLQRLLDWVGTGSGRVPAVYVEEASYIKLREIGLYYNIPTTLTSNLFNGAIQGIRLGVSANNILAWTNYGSYDPEVSNFGAQPINSNVEVTPYPSSRRFFFHLTVNF